MRNGENIFLSFIITIKSAETPQNPRFSKKTTPSFENLAKIHFNVNWSLEYHIHSIKYNHNIFFFLRDFQTGQYQLREKKERIFPVVSSRLTQPQFVYNRKTDSSVFRDLIS